MKFCPGTLYVARGMWSFHFGWVCRVAVDYSCAYENTTSSTTGHDNFGNRGQSKFIKIHNLQVLEGCVVLVLDYLFGC